MEPSVLSFKTKPLPSNRLECSICQQKFWMKSKYLDHMSSHSSHIQSPFLLSCNICNKSFYNQAHLDEHYLVHNEVIKTYDCTKCNRKFSQQYQLQQHMQFHMIPTSYESSEKKKSVHFHEVFKSKNISDDDFSDDLPDESEFYNPPKKIHRKLVVRESTSEDDFSDNMPDESRLYNTVKKTRSGRVVKAKRIFENEERSTKHRSKKVIEASEKMSATLEYVDTTSSNIIKFIEDSDVSKTSNRNTSVENDVSSNSNSHISESDKFSSINNEYAAVLAKSKSLQVVLKRDDILAKKASSQNISPVKLHSHTGLQKVSPVKLHSHIGLQKVSPVKLHSHTSLQTTSPAKMHSHTSIQNTSAKLHLQTSSSTQLTCEKNHVSSATTENTPCFSSTLPSASIPNKVPSITPQIQREYLYVGPAQDLEKIKTVVEEMKSISKQGPTNKSDHDSSAIKHTTSSSDNKQVTSSENTNVISKNLLPDDMLKGVVNKKVVDNFVVVQVTPELMQQINRKTLQAQSPVNILKTSSGTNKTYSVNPLRNNNNNVPTKGKVHETKEKNNQLITSATKPAKPNLLSEKNMLAKREKLLQKYMAKLEEKERKKKEKYQLKKRMRHMKKYERKNYLVEKKPNSKKAYSNMSENRSNKKTPDIVKKSEQQKTIQKKQSKSFKNDDIGKNINETELQSQSIDKLLDKDPYSDISIITNETFTEKCPCKSMECSKTCQSYLQTIDKTEFGNNSVEAHHEKSESNHKQQNSSMTEEDAIEKAHEISLKFNSNLSVEECLAALNDLDYLFTLFNISKKCMFIYKILRFCRLNVESYEVKERAISLHAKIMKSARPGS